MASEQWYRRLAIDRWQYTSGEYDYQLVIDPVEDYGSRLATWAQWHQVAAAARGT